MEHFVRCRTPQVLAPRRSIHPSYIYSMLLLLLLYTEVADALPYNHKADVYSFGVILWELNASKKPFEGLNREMFYERVVHGGERPPLSKKWPTELGKLIKDCWSEDIEKRPSFGQIIARIDKLLLKEKDGGSTKNSPFRRISGMIDRHSTWF